MRYLTKNHPDAIGEWCICEDGKIVTRLGSTDQDKRQAVSLLASGSPLWASLVAAAEEFPTWESDPGIAYEGIATSDKRQIEDGALTWRTLPLPLMWQTETAWGHDGAVIAGAIDQVERRDGGVIWGAGRFDTGEMGVEAQRLTSSDIMRGVSVDVGAAEVDFEVIEVDEDDWPIDWLEHLIAGELMGLTGTPFPAFADARIKASSVAVVEEDDDEDEPEMAVAASGRRVLTAAAPLRPKRSWFTMPEPDFDSDLLVEQFTEEGESVGWACPMTIVNDEQVYGHLAFWGQPHIGGYTVHPPNSRLGYRPFYSGPEHFMETGGGVVCSDGRLVQSGPVTAACDHAIRELRAPAARDHYANSGLQWADISVVDGAFGPWACGALRSDVTPEQIRVLRAGGWSGDWRGIGNHLELIGVLAVTTPGFAVRRRLELVASGMLASVDAPTAELYVENGEPISLVAAATVRRCPECQRRIEESLGMDGHAHLPRALLELAAAHIDGSVTLRTDKEISTILAANDALVV